jgi:glycerol-3-phosphate dehydrogenase (NAD(P)+)
MTNHTSIGVLGGGAWGTALAQLIAQGSRKVVLWALEKEVVREINEKNSNTKFLPSIGLSQNISATNDISDLTDLDLILAVTPAQHLRSTLCQLKKPPLDLILCSKGIETSTGLFMHDVARETLPESNVAVLSGPTFANEVAVGLPTAVTLACSGGAKQWSRLISAVARPNFRPYFTADLIGAEIGGSIKNVLAIACGVVEGLKLGQNARAALIARGYAEMLRFGDALGGNPETLSGLCGFGDLVLTCTSSSSRNFSLGHSLGEGLSVGDVVSGKETVAEGLYTAPGLLRLAKKHKIEMPIVEAVVAILEGADPSNIVSELLSRPLTTEKGEPV